MGGTQRRDQRNQTPKEGKTKDGTSSSSALARHPYLMSSGAILLIVCIVAVMIWWWHARQYEATDDAFIDARIVPISSQVAGAVIDVPVTANQLVGPGALLVQIDPHDDKVAVEQAQIDQAKATISNLDARIDAQRARINQADKQLAESQAAEAFAKQENDRAQDLLIRGAGTQEQAQQNFSNYTQAQANVASGDANLSAMRERQPSPGD